MIWKESLKISLLSKAISLLFISAASNNLTKERGLNALVPKGEVRTPFSYNKAKWKYSDITYTTFRNGNSALIIVVVTAYIWSSPKTISFYPYSQLITGKSSWVFILKCCNNSVNNPFRRTQEILFPFHGKSCVIGGKPLKTHMLFSKNRNT